MSGKMAKAIRYALAAVCLGASVGCLALWQRGMTQRDVFIGPSFMLPNQALGFTASLGLGSVHLVPGRLFQGKPWRYSTATVKDWQRHAQDEFVAERGYFTLTGFDDHGAAIYFPLWYLALVFALAGVGVLCFRRRLSIRSALIGLAVVATLLGMAVTL